MEDSSQVLEHGTGTPYVAIFNNLKEVIIEPKSGLPLGTFITNFQYDYLEEGPDEGSFIIDCDNPDVMDIPALGYEMIIYLQWGYIFSKNTHFCGPLRKVIITNTTVNFSERGVRATVEFSDATILLKNQQAEYYNNQSLNGWYDYYMDICNNNPTGLAIIDYHEIPIQHHYIGQEYRGETPLNKLFTGDKVNDYFVIQNNGFWDQFGLPIAEILPQHASMKVENATGYTLFDMPANPDSNELKKNWEKLKTYLEKEPDLYKQIVIERKVANISAFIGTPKNKYGQFKQFTKSLPSEDPMYMDGRDGKLTIHNRQYDRPITKTYTYFGGNGELLSFEVESKTNRTSTSVAQSSDITPDKNMDNVTVQAHEITDETKGEEGKVILYQGEEESWFKKLLNLLYYGTSSSMFEVFSGRRKLGKAESKYGGTSSIEHTQQYWNNNISQSNLYYANQYYGEAINPLLSNNNLNDYKSFDSTEDAIQYYNSNPGITSEELENYIKETQRVYNSRDKFYQGAKNLTDQELGDILHNLDKFPPFKFKRKFLLRLYIDPRNPNPQALEIVNNKTFGMSFLDYLNTRGDMAVISVNNATDGEIKYYTYNTVRLVEQEFTIDGVKALTSEVKLNSKFSMGNDVINSVINRVEATARVVGDPIIESSMNINILNVSKRFSGVWYTKKVSHNINPQSGYICDIEFVRKDKTISKTVIKASTATNNLVEKLRQNVREAEKAGKNPGTARSKLEILLENVREANPLGSIVATPGENSNEYKIYNVEHPNGYVDNLDFLSTKIDVNKLNEEEM